MLIKLLIDILKVSHESDILRLICVQLPCERVSTHNIMQKPCRLLQCRDGFQLDVDGNGQGRSIAKLSEPFSHIAMIVCSHVSKSWWHFSVSTCLIDSLTYGTERYLTWERFVEILVLLITRVWRYEGTHVFVPTM